MRLNNTSLGSGGNDFRSIDSLRSSAARDPKSSIRETAKQFESLFMQEVMKSMRAATMSSEMMENSATKLGMHEREVVGQVRAAMSINMSDLPRDKNAIAKK